MRKALSIITFTMAMIAFSNLATAQVGGGGGGGGSGTGGVGAGADGGGFGGGDGQFGASRPGSRDDIAANDSRSATNTGQNNLTLGDGQGAANNMGFLNALFGGNAGNQNVNQNQAIKGRGIRAPLRLGFKFEGKSVDSGMKKLNARIVRLPKFKNSKITGVLQEKTLLLVGEVASPEEVALAVRIARFEPGVDQVKSLLTVANSK